MRRPSALPLSATPGFIPCGPGRPMTDEQRERVFGAYGQKFVNHLSALVSDSLTHVADPDARNAGVNEPLTGSLTSHNLTVRPVRPMPVKAG